MLPLCHRLLNLAIEHDLDNHIVGLVGLYGVWQYHFKPPYLDAGADKVFFFITYYITGYIMDRRRNKKAQS